MIDPPSWPVEPDDLEDDEPVAAARWRRWVVWSIAALLVVLMLAGPIWRAIDISQPPIADNGLAVCTFDYCEIQDAVREAGLGAEMVRLAGIRLDADEAQELATSLTDVLGESPVRVVTVDRLPGEVAGRYDTAARTIEVEEPIRAWIVVHEAAHAVATGHSETFERVLIDLVGAIAAG